MTVPTRHCKAGPYVCDGKTTRFPFDFALLKGEHIFVYLNHARTDWPFTVEMEEGHLGGTVVMQEAPRAGTQLLILRRVPITQWQDLQNRTAFYPEILERAYDKLTMICQQLREMLSRAVIVPPGVEPNWEELMDLLMEAAEKAKEAADRAQDILDQILEIPWDKYAPLESPHFTGVPTAPTAGKGTNTDQLATTAFVQQEIEDFLVSVKVSFTKAQWVDVTAALETASEEERKILKTALLNGDTAKKIFRIVTEMKDYSHVYKIVKEAEAGGDTASTGSEMAKVAEIEGTEGSKDLSKDGPYAVESCDSVEVRVMDKGYIMLLAADGFDGYIYTIGKRLPVEYNYSRVNGGVAITGIKTNRAHWTDLTIPSSIQEGDTVLPVVEIADAAFMGNTVITSVVIGEGVVKINSSAFASCTSLTKLVLPSSLREICVNFIHSTPNLKELTLNEGLTTIRENAFNAACLESLRIPASVTLVEDGAIYSRSWNLKKFEVAPENPNYKCEDSCLYTKDGTVFMAYLKHWEPSENLKKSLQEAAQKKTQAQQAAATEESGADGGEGEAEAAPVEPSVMQRPEDEKKSNEFTVKNGVTRIASAAFVMCGFKTLTFPSGVTQIDSDCFSYCSVGELKLPNTITKVGSAAFALTVDTITLDGNGGGGTLSLDKGVLYDDTTHTLLRCPLKAEAINGTAESGGSGGNNKTYKVKDGATKVGMRSFEKVSLNELDLNQVVSLENDALRGLTVTTIKLGAAFTTWGSQYGVNSTKVEVDSGNTHYEVGENGNSDVLFNKGKTQLIHFPPNKNGTNKLEYTVPESVTEIMPAAIVMNSHLKKLTMPNVTTLYAYAISSCSNLKEVKWDKIQNIWGAACWGPWGGITSLTFPATLEVIAAGAVTHMASLSEVTFQKQGTWRMDNGVFTDCPKLFTIKGHKGSSAEDYAKANNYHFEEIKNGQSTEEKKES